MNQLNKEIEELNKEIYKLEISKEILTLEQLYERKKYCYDSADPCGRYTTRLDNLGLKLKFRLLTQDQYDKEIKKRYHEFYNTK